MLHSAVRRWSESPGHSLMPGECWGKKVKMVGSWGTGMTRIHLRTAEFRRAQSSAALGFRRELRAHPKQDGSPGRTPTRQAVSLWGRTTRLDPRQGGGLWGAGLGLQGKTRGRGPGRVTNHVTRSPNTRQPLRPRSETGTSRGPAGPFRLAHWTKALVNH